MINGVLFLWYLLTAGSLIFIIWDLARNTPTLVALMLMIAESNPKDKDVVIKVIVNLINKRKNEIHRY